MKFGLLLRAHRQYNSSGGGVHVHVLDIPEELVCDIKVTAGLVLLSVTAPHNKESGAAPSVTSLQFYSRRYRRTVGPGGKCSSLKCNFIPATEMRQPEPISAPNAVTDPEKNQKLQQLIQSEGTRPAAERTPLRDDPKPRRHRLHPAKPRRYRHRQPWQAAEGKPSPQKAEGAEQLPDRCGRPGNGGTATFPSEGPPGR